MKFPIKFSFKEYFWKSLNKATNTFSNLTVNNLGNGYVKCFWEISPVDNFRIEFSKSCFYAIRIFDISNNRNKDKSTCIMKEIQVNKFQSSISFPIPMNKGSYYFELGFRKRNGEWRKLAKYNLNMGYRIKKKIRYFDTDNWFNPKTIVENLDQSQHEKSYQLSLNTRIGGSENIKYKKESS